MEDTEYSFSTLLAQAVLEPSPLLGKWPAECWKRCLAAAARTAREPGNAAAAGTGHLSPSTLRNNQQLGTAGSRLTTVAPCKRMGYKIMSSSILPKAFCYAEQLRQSSLTANPL